MIGFAGRLVEQKGVLDLLEAAAGMPGPWRLRLIGAGPLEAHLRARARALGVGDRLELVGSIPSSAMPEALRGLDLLALPSRTQPNWKEQFGRVLVEAMSCGVPVVGSSSGEVPQVIGQAGLVVPEGNVGALRESLGRLLSDTTLREKLARAGRARVLERFTQRQVAEETVQVYREVCAGISGSA